MNLRHWESYYERGALVSCPTNPEPWYTMEVRDAWVSLFAALDDGARILDLGTGNGAVALIASEAAAEQGRRYRIDGVDLARIDPKRHVPGGEQLLAGIEFHGGIDIEALPFPDASYEAVCGQYVVEYADAEASLREILRVLVPGGRCQLIAHHRDSIIVGNAAESLRQADLVRHETGTLEVFRAYCDRPEPAERSALYAAGERLQGEARASGNPLLLDSIIDSISAMLATRSRTGRDEMKRRTDELEKELDDWVRRLGDLVAAAWSHEDIGRIEDTLSALDFVDLEVSEQHQDGDKLVGWRLTMAKADARSD